MDEHNRLKRKFLFTNLKNLYFNAGVFEIEGGSTGKSETTIAAPEYCWVNISAQVHRGHVCYEINF